PAFRGMGTPYWKKDAKATSTGLTFGSDRSHLIRAALESVCSQIKDVILATGAEHQLKMSQLMVNGGMSKNKFVVQFLAALLNKPVVCGAMADASALGCARLAGIGVWETSLEVVLPQNENNTVIFYPSSSQDAT